MSSASVMLDTEEPRVRIDWLKGLEGSFMVCGACLLMPLMSYAKEPYYMGGVHADTLWVRSAASP